jgi:hypothetical protein
MTRATIIRDLRYLQQKIDAIIKELETGPENSREEVAPMGRNTTRDWHRARLAAALELAGRRADGQNQPPSATWLAHPLLIDRPPAICHRHGGAVK